MCRAGNQLKTGIMAATVATADTAREKSLTDYRKKLLEHKELEARLKESKHSIVCFNGAVGMK